MATLSTKLRSLLPKNFSPCPDDVVIGRGRKIVEHNKLFYKIIHSEMEAYSTADSKATKSLILVRVVKHVREVSMGKFVKQDPDSKRWYEVEESLARTTVAQALRDSLHNTYRSSKQFKQRRRKQAKISAPPAPAVITEPAALKASPQGGSSSATTTTMMTAVQSAMNKKRKVPCVVPTMTAAQLLLPPPENRSQSLERLRDILDEATDISSMECLFPSCAPQQQHEEPSSSFLDILLDSTPIQMHDGNPFEPRPIAETGVKKDVPFQLFDDMDVRDIHSTFAV